MSADKTANQPPQGRAARRRALGNAEKETKAVNLVTSERQHEGAVTAKKARPTPSRRKMEEAEEESGNVVTRTGSGLADYFQGVRSEIDKIAWPSRDDARRLTTIVLIALVLSSVALGGIATLFTEVFRIGLDAPILLFGIMLLAVGGGIIYNRLNSRKSSGL
ncbi:MAG: preprotein translocase subunit SecE [bacterium]|nr:preprotein translocase subunit SecE [bacterium]